ncbi:MAG: SpoIIE family protein phosphatase [Oscillatoria sp. PMC 1051.18]|nr:SpoIIE family protein phosphatase [Oscillatoria sp. PMC 1050.18]MEC5032892.1 SpoIIE family protein phosphatase [Oscillatoria sp. PMC 1051.18]
MAQILIIDDDPGIQLLLKRALAKQGYEVTVASDGDEGLALARKLCPAMIVCDWIMPRLSGLEVCRHVKAAPELSTTFFILLTSLGSIDDRVKGLDAGADDFLCKPIEMYELLARVRSGLRQHQLASDLNKQKQLLEAELAQAAEYVCSILPEPLTEPPVFIDVRFIPSSQLGGDSFDYFWLDEIHLAMYLLDVSGHGLRAALPSLSVLNLLRSRGLPKVNYHQPSDVLRGLNYAFQMTQRNDKYFTIWYGVYNIQTRELVYASAGHPPAVLLHSQPIIGIQRQDLKTPGFPVGMFPDAEYLDAKVKITRSTSLYLFSDGIYEINQPDGTVWGLDNFINKLQEYQKLPNRHLDLLIEQIKRLNPHEVLDDDVSLMQIDFS